MMGAVFEAVLLIIVYLMTMSRLTLKFFLATSLSLISLQNVDSRKSKMLVEQSFADTNNTFKHDVRIHNDIDRVCSGALIADNYVLTAAHCVYNSTTIGTDHKIVKVTSGIVNVYSEEPQVLRLAEIIYVPKKFKYGVKAGEVVGDIAVIKLNYGVGIGINPRVSALNIITSINNDVYKKPSYMFTGFGSTISEKEFIPELNKTDYVQKNHSEQLRYATANVVRSEECSLTPEKSKELLCARLVNNSGKKSGTCSGDSGGALFDIASKTVVGVLSYGIKSCDDRKIATKYTKVQAYLKFIQDAMVGKPDPSTTRTISFRENPHYLAYLNRNLGLFTELTSTN